MLVLFSTALALVGPGSTTTVDCPLGEDALCDRVDQMIQHVNDDAGDEVIVSDASRSRLRPERVYAALRRMDDALAVHGCSLVGEAGGSYLDAWEGHATVDGNPNNPMPAASFGPIDRVAKTFPGSVTGHNVVGHTFFGQWSTYNRHRRFVATVTSPPATTTLWAGHWIRVAGRSGVFVGGLVECAQGADPSVVMEDWYGDLSSFRP